MDETQKKAEIMPRSNIESVPWLMKGPPRPHYSCQSPLFLKIFFLAPSLSFL